MAGKHLMKSGALAALAAGLAFAAAPSVANAQDEHGRHGGWQQNDGEGRGNAGNWQGRGNGGGNGGGWQGRQAERQAQPQAQPPAQVQVQQAPRMERQGGFWGQRGDGGQPQRQERQVGSSGQRGDGGQRQPQGGFWGQRERTYQAPQAVERSYVDPNRNRSYTPRDGQRWQGQNSGLTSGQNWTGNRDGRTWDRDRRWDGNRTGGWNRDWRRDNRFGWQTYRNQHRDVFRMGRYYSPYNNWSYRRLGIGVTLQPLFFSQDYWIDDPWMYRLPEAYGPYRWVRYYDDALLVNIYDGEVVDVIYDFFW